MIVTGVGSIRFERVFSVVNQLTEMSTTTSTRNFHTKPVVIADFENNVEEVLLTNRVSSRRPDGLVLETMQQTEQTNTLLYNLHGPSIKHRLIYNVPI